MWKQPVVWIHVCPNHDPAGRGGGTMVRRIFTFEYIAKTLLQSSSQQPIGQTTGSSGTVD